jgi:hypothetical protein
MLKKTLLSLAALGAVAGAAAPAAAQSWPGDPDHDRGYHAAYRYGGPSAGYIDNLDWRIMKAAREHRISWREAGELRADQRLARDLAWQGQTRPLRPWEERRLTVAVQRIEARTSDYADNARYGYGYGYDRDAWRR